MIAPHWESPWARYFDLPPTPLGMQSICTPTGARIVDQYFRTVEEVNGLTGKSAELILIEDLGWFAPKEAPNGD